MLLDTVLKVYVPTQAFCVYQTRQLINRRDGASGIEYALIAHDFLSAVRNGKGRAV